MKLSIVIPLFNEAESLPELHRWITEVMRTNDYDYEIIFIDDGSRDSSWEVIEDLRRQNVRVKGIQFQRNYGKSPALNEGFALAQGQYVITMDADLQDSPEEIPELIEVLEEGDFDLVSGWKKKRYDNTITKNLPSKLYNYSTTKLSGVKLHDMNCGLKIYRNEVVKSIEIYGEMHRYIPVLAKAAGFNKIGEKPVQHQKRKYGESKFGVERFIRGFLDLASVTFISKYGRRPMHFFGFWGTIMFLLGFVIVIYLVFSKFYWNVGLVNRPPFFMALTVMILGTVFFLTGFLGELIIRNAPDRNKYLIKKTIGD